MRVYQICAFYERWAFSVLVWALPYVLATFKYFMQFLVTLIKKKTFLKFGFQGKKELDTEMDVKHSRVLNFK